MPNLALGAMFVPEAFYRVCALDGAWGYSPLYGAREKALWQKMVLWHSKGLKEDRLFCLFLIGRFVTKKTILAASSCTHMRICTPLDASIYMQQLIHQTTVSDAWFLQSLLVHASKKCHELQFARKSISLDKMDILK